MRRPIGRRQARAEEITQIERAPASRGDLPVEDADAGRVAVRKQEIIQLEVAVHQGDRRFGKQIL